MLESVSDVLKRQGRKLAHKIGVFIAAVYSENVQQGNRDWVHFQSRPSEGIVQILDPIGIIYLGCARRALVPESAESKYRHDGEKRYLVDGKGIREAHIIDSGESLQLADGCNEQYTEQFLQASIQNSALDSTGQEDRLAENQTVCLASTEDDKEN